MTQLSVKRISNSPISTSESGDTPHAESTDLSLMKRLANNDSDAMTRLLEEYGEWLARLIGRLLAWAPDHEDVFQEVLIQVWQKAKTYHGQGSLQGWLRKIATNRCRNHQRWQNTFRSFLIGLLDFKTNERPQPNSGPNKEIDLSTPIQTALTRLPTKDREVLVLYYLEESTTAEIAQCLGIKTDSVHSRLSRAREKLKTEFPQTFPQAIPKEVKQ